MGDAGLAHISPSRLTPQRVARAPGVSVRTLYRLCEEGGLSLEKWVIRRRLEGAREDLAAAEQACRAVEAIARSWGFAHPAHFFRRFRETYGTRTSEWRRHSRNHLSRRAAPPP
ncbi:helix-turn-helix domain-containing protein [Streptomyces sp. NPDC008137]|uniref:helix-turn-helix transcriptional regulator n=1 Tax=Streptomyces sp. NPDC008137 TaxID=3364813 RepID=UPI0036E737E5